MDDVILNKNSVLLHACCAPCSVPALYRLNNEFNTIIYYSNSNLNSYNEYFKRLNSFNILKKFFNFSLYLDPYDCKTWDKLTCNNKNEKERGKRCYICIKHRLEQSFLFAKKNNLDIVSSTLSTAPYKDSNMIFEIAKNLELKYKIKFLYENFKKKDGFKLSIDFSKKNNLYLQNYCGCKYSLKDRMSKVEA